MILRKSSFIGIVSFAYLFLLYMFSEQIKIETIVLLLGFISFALLFRISIWQFSVPTRLLLLYILIGTFTTLIGGNAKTDDLVEFVAALIIGIIFCSIILNENMRESQIRAVKSVSAVAFLGCILQIFVPDLLSLFNQMRMGSTKYSWYLDFQRSGFIIGFSFQTAVTGFYLSILIAYIFCKLIGKDISTRSKTLGIIMLLICYVLLFQTGKRIFIVLTLMIGLFLFAMHNKKHIFKIVVISIVALCVLFLLLNYTLIGQRLIMRAESLDPTRGRMGIYAQLWASFLQKPILGNGLTSTLQLLNGFQNGHNIYLQILSESGLIGFFLIIPVFIINMINAIRLLVDGIRNKENTSIISFCLFIELLFIGWGFTGNPLYDVYPFVVYMIIVGVVNSIILEKRNEYRN